MPSIIKTGCPVTHVGDQGSAVRCRIFQAS